MTDIEGFEPVPDGFLRGRHHAAPKMPGSDLPPATIEEARRRSAACEHAAPAACLCPEIRWCGLYAKEVNGQDCHRCKLAELAKEAAG